VVVEEVEENKVDLRCNASMMDGAASKRGFQEAGVLKDIVDEFKVSTKECVRSCGQVEILWLLL